MLSTLSSFCGCARDQMQALSRMPTAGALFGTMFRDGDCRRNRLLSAQPACASVAEEWLTTAEKGAGRKRLTAQWTFTALDGEDN